MYTYINIYASDNKSVYIQLEEFFYLCVSTIIQVIILLFVKNELSRI